MTNSKLSIGLKKANSRLLHQNSRKILHNVFLLYVVLFASIIDLLYMVSTGSHINVILFIVAAYVTYSFSKNMTVILIVALAITNIYHLGKSIVIKEGFEEGPEEKESEDKESEEKESEDKESEEKELSEKEPDDTAAAKKKPSKGSDSGNRKTNANDVAKLPDEYKQTLAQLSDPETLKTIEGLKSLEPLIGKMERVISMFK